MHAILALEEASLAGMPALSTTTADGWLLRFADGYSRRANSVWPLYPARREPLDKLATCEAAYARAGLPCVFKMTPASTPPGLDDLLAARGYRLDAETLVCARPVDGGDAGNGPTAQVELYDDPAGDWWDTWCRLHERPPGSGVFRRLLAAIATPAVYALVRHGGVGVACARAAMARDIAGFYDLLVDPDHRRRGLGTALTRARLDWSRRQGARRVFLQVMAHNVAERALAARAGFDEAYRYWYRVQPQR